MQPVLYPDVLEEQVRLRFEAGLHIDDTLASMLGQGLYAIPSMKLVRKYLGITLHHAKDIVHNSPVCYGPKAEGNRRSQGDFDRIAQLAAQRRIAEDQSLKPTRRT